MNAYSEILTALEKIIRGACEKYLAEKPQTFSHKTVNDILTDTDLKMQKYILGEMEKAYPNVKIISEEKDNEELRDGLCVCVDPLDGTCNFSAGIPMYGVQAAVFEGKQPVASIIRLPLSDETYMAAVGEGVTKNGERLILDTSTQREEAVLLISDFYPNIDVDFDKQYELVKRLQSRFLKTRLFGAACFDFSMLLTGKAQAYVCYYHEIWDIAPGLLMAKELGMNVGSLFGGYKFKDSSLVIASSKEIADEIRAVYKTL